MTMLHARREILDLLLWVRAMGTGGAIVYGLAYAAGTIVLFPGMLLTLGAGAIYGPLWGVLIVVPGSLAGASLAFLIARRIGRVPLERRLLRRLRLETLDRAVARHGFKVVLLIRLDPVFLPFAPLNYALGLTGVRFRDYLFASWLGMLPGTILYVYLGSLVPQLAGLGSEMPAAMGRWRPWLLLLGAAVLTALVIIVARAAGDILSQRGLANPRKEH